MTAQNYEGAKEYAIHRLERELPPGLFYHNVEHSRRDVVPAVEMLAEGEDIRGESLLLLLTAAWFHDIGFIEVRYGHEAVSVRIASDALPGFGYTEDQIQIIKGIILATVLPQSPATILEKIMADADLDVLGREDFMLSNHNLRREFAYFGEETSDFEWYSGQLTFIESHMYFTATAHRTRDAGKELNIAKLKQVLEKANR